MRLRHKMFVVSALVLVAALFVKAQAPPDTQTTPGEQTPLQGKEVFRKQLPDKSTLLVLRTPGVYVKKPSRIPGGRVIDPDSVDVMSLFLIASDGKTHRLLWKRQFLVYLTNPSKQKGFIRCLGLIPRSLLRLCRLVLEAL